VACVNFIIVECPYWNEAFPMEWDNGTCYPHVVSRWYFSNGICQKNIPNYLKLNHIVLIFINCIIRKIITERKLN
jgi:hypothetical protein